MYYLTLYFISTFSQLILHTVVNGYNGNIVSLCDDPVFYSADRLLNNSIRFYRGEHYWELYGRPDKRGSLWGPHRIWWPGFHTVFSTTSVVTVLGKGDRVGRTLRIEGRRYNSWLEGRHVESGDLPIPHSGIRTIFHNDNPTNPMFIALESNRVLYMTTKPWDWPRIVGYSDGYIGGQFGENFETEIDAAFSYPSSDPADEYNLYFFRKDKYCVRTAKKKCDHWRLNKELFGCPNTNATTEGMTKFPTFPTFDVITSGNYPTLPPDDNFSLSTPDKADENTTEPANARSFDCCRTHISFATICLVFVIQVFA